jgi:hypothetical protein
MKKSLIALATLAAATGAMAQSTVALTGNMVLGLGSTKTGPAVTGAMLQRQTGNFAIKGTEDLGAGLKANFEVQTSIGAAAGSSLNNARVLNASGTTTTPTLLGDRGAYINLQGGFGAVQAGRANSAARSMMAIGDVSRITVASAAGVSAGSSAGASNAAGGDAGAFAIYGDAYSNYVAYSTPSFSGFSAAIALVPVDGNTAVLKDAMSYSLSYAGGPLAASINYVDSRQTSGGQAIAQGTGTTADSLYFPAMGAYKMTTMAASYDMGAAKFGLMYQDIDTAVGVNPGAGTLVTVNVPFGATSIGLGYGLRSNTATTDLHFGDGVKNTFVGVRHDLSKRTHLQAYWANVNRQGTATDVTQTMFTLGHSF